MILPSIYFAKSATNSVFMEFLFIGLDDLFNKNHFDIEHTIPFSRSLDDSFINKTLCEATENKNVKKKPHSLRSLLWG